MVPGILAISALLVIAFGSWAMVMAATRPVSAGAIDAFATRQRLRALVVLDNPDVLRYLATTRRWRVGGLVVAFVFALGRGIRVDHIGIDLGAAFLGWFAAALIAEWRLNAPRHATPRTALLTRRSLRNYLGVPAIVVPCLALAALVAVAGYDFVHVPAMSMAAVLASSLAPAASAAVTARHVLLRPAVGSSPDIDHALRSRSLHALSGAATVCSTYGIAALVLISPQLDPSGSQLIPFAVLAAGTVVGWLVGLAPGPAL